MYPIIAFVFAQRKVVDDTGEDGEKLDPEGQQNADDAETEGSQTGWGKQTTR